MLVDKSGVAWAGLSELLLTLGDKLAGWRGFDIDGLSTDHVERLHLLVYLLLFLLFFLYDIHSVVVQLSLFLWSGVVVVCNLLVLHIQLNDVLLSRASVDTLDRTHA